MPEHKLTKDQRAVVRAKRESTLFLEGPAGTGKTTAGVERIAHWLAADVPPASILVLLPQRTLGEPYLDLLRDPGAVAGGQITIGTLGSLARRAVDLFWPLVAEDYGFKQPTRRPTFLSLETAQYFMARVVGPVIDHEGYFETVSIDRNRLFSQVLDNLNKAALIGFPVSEIGPRLKAAWIGDDAQRRMYDDVQRSADRFRAYCLEHNLLDFSLLAEIFMGRLWPMDECRRYFTRQYRYIVADNVEEDSPAAHQLLADWLPVCASATVIYDTESGFRRFLGADPDDAYRLKSLCERQIALNESFVATPSMSAFADQLALSLQRRPTPDERADPAPPAANERSAVQKAIQFDDHRYHPQMVDWVAGQIAWLVKDQGVEPGEIVVLAPYLSDALRFSLMNRLASENIPARSHRPSRALREEPAALCLLTLAQIAHLDWNMRPAVFDLIYALMTAIDRLDLVRAQLLGRGIYAPGKSADAGAPLLQPFDTLKTDIQERITFALGGQYEWLRAWISTYIQEGATEIDVFFSRLFGEVLSQSGFGFYNRYDYAEIAANLIDSARNFRQIVTESGTVDGQHPLGREYVEMVGRGLIADQYLRRWELEEKNAVLLAPAYTFLMSNRPVDYQFWLNVGGAGWSERLYQPLTNPYVLTLGWEPGRTWTDLDEQAVSQDALYRLAIGLIRRCRKQIYLGFSELGEGGYEQRGALLEAIQRMLRRMAAAG
jgi:hypothetical protein